jgi:hypothetical protein
VAIIMAYEWVWRKAAKIKEKDEWNGFEGTGRARSASEAPKRHVDRGASSGGIGGGGSSSQQEPRTMRGRGGMSRATRPRRLSSQLSPDSRPMSGQRLSRSPWSGTSDDDDDHGAPSNAELMEKIEHLTTLVATMQQQMQQTSMQTRAPPPQ